MTEKPTQQRLDELKRLSNFFSLLIGCGLMALMFFSSRSGHDDAADPFRDRRDPPAE
jgi:hypothetical protein